MSLVENVEYDGDPGWGEAASVPRGPRTFESRLRSFGFLVHFPDMNGPTSEHRKASRGTDYRHDWMRVTVSTGERHPQEGFLDRLTKATVERRNEIMKSDNYRPASSPVFGLTRYVAFEIDPKTGKSYSEGIGGHEIFIFRDDQGRVQSFIRCDKSPYLSLCHQTFELSPDAHADVSVQYAAWLLHDWQAIQDSVRVRMLGFREAG